MAKVLLVKMPSNIYAIDEEDAPKYRGHAYIVLRGPEDVIDAWMTKEKIDAARRVFVIFPVGDESATLEQAADRLWTALMATARSGPPKKRIIGGEDVFGQKRRAAQVPDIRYWVAKSFAELGDQTGRWPKQMQQCILACLNCANPSGFTSTTVSRSLVTIATELSEERAKRVFMYYRRRLLAAGFLATAAQTSPPRWRRI